MCDKASIVSKLLRVSVAKTGYFQRPVDADWTLSEMPDEMVTRLSDSDVVHIIDALVPLRSINTFTRQVKRGDGSVTPMLGVDLVEMHRQQFVASHKRYARRGRRVTTVLSFDKSSKVPITKGLVQAERRKKKKEPSPQELEDAKVPLKEVGPNYVTLETELRRLGIWKLVMDDRLPAQDGTDEHTKYVKQPDGGAQLLHMGRRQEIIKFVCFNLLVRPEGSTDESDLDPARAVRHARLSLAPGHSVILEGHCMHPDFFRTDSGDWMRGFFEPAPGLLTDPERDWNCTPVAAWSNDAGELCWRFVEDYHNELGEADLSIFRIAQHKVSEPESRCKVVVFESTDTDVQLLSMRFARLHPTVYVVVRAPKHLSAYQQSELVLASELGQELNSKAWPLYVDAAHVATKIEEALIEYTCPLETFLCAMLSRGSDYTLPFRGVTHQRFWEALVNQRAFIGSRLVTQRDDGRYVVDASTWLRLVAAAYAHAHHARVLLNGKIAFETRQQIEQVLRGELARPQEPGAKKKPKLAPLSVKKQMPAQQFMRGRFGNALYVFEMFMQLAVVDRLELPEDREGLEPYGFAPDDLTKEFTRLNIKTLADDGLDDEEEDADE